KVQLKEEHISGRIAAMVSGGVDSMVMLDLLVRGGADVFAVHVNHNIREEADFDCAFVEDYCKNKNIPFIKYSFDIPAMANESGRSIETEARIARRSVIDELIQSGKADRAAVAHHMDDNAETILMHILRGSGVDGLKGIGDSDKIIRPLLNYTRDDIKEYALNNNIRYVEDKTNYDSSYTRNFIRLEVLPLIKTRYPGVVDSLNRLGRSATQTIEALDGGLDDSFIKTEGDTVKLSLAALDSPLAVRYIIKAAKMLMPVDITSVQIQNVLNLSDRTGSKAELANGLKAYREYDCITFCFDHAADDFCVPFAEGITELNGLVIKVQKVQPKLIRGKTIIAAPIPEGCEFRRRREGDSFVPYGGKKKSLKKYLIDKKIPKRLRDDLVCLCLGSEVLAIVGLEISDKCKITSSTTAAYLITKETK
ncbi:MAG: tRNA lysidine(34) synthetase TilS, partial [Clostridiales bacterium]|nr:tRNA lysidine(34) synthetase TilS [Clostridiales bacterium]